MMYTYNLHNNTYMLYIDLNMNQITFLGYMEGM